MSRAWDGCFGARKCDARASLRLGVLLKITNGILTK